MSKPKPVGSEELKDAILRMMASARGAGYCALADRHLDVEPAQLGLSNVAHRGAPAGGRPGGQPAREQWSNQMIRSGSH